MRRISQIIEKIARFSWENADAVLVIVVGIGVAALEIFGNPSKEVVDGAILALLAATAVVLLRDREERRAEHGELAALKQLANDAISDRPYEVVWQTNHWDLVERHRAVVTQIEQIRITRIDVATNFQWSRGDGETESTDARWRRSRSAAWISAKKIYDFPVRGGIKEIFCFDEEHSQGDMLEWCTERVFRNRFPSDHEGVELEARVKSDHPRTLRITWPADSPPSHVEMRHGAQPARMLSPKRKKGRCFVEEKVPGLQIGEVVRIDWTW
ncbi:MAG: hypothetical protein ACTHN7_05335 [Solirubrobacterales bacterium]